MSILEFDSWFLGSPYLESENSEDFSAWFLGSPLLQNTTVTLPVSVQAAVPYESRFNVVSRTVLPYASSGRLQYMQNVLPYDVVGSVEALEFLSYESSGQPGTALSLFWNVRNPALLNVPLVLIWDVVPGPGVMMRLTLQWNVRDKPAPLTLRWRVLPTLPQLWEHDIQKPVTTITESP